MTTFPCNADGIPGGPDATNEDVDALAALEDMARLRGSARFHLREIVATGELPRWLVNDAVLQGMTYDEITELRELAKPDQLYDSRFACLGSTSTCVEKIAECQQVCAEFLERLARSSTKLAIEAERHSVAKAVTMLVEREVPQAQKSKYLVLAKLAIDLLGGGAVASIGGAMEELRKIPDKDEIFDRVERGLGEILNVYKRPNYQVLVERADRLLGADSEVLFRNGEG